MTTLADQGRRVFGEGLTILNDEIVQLTWQERAGVRLRPRRQAQAADAQSARRLGPVATTAPTCLFTDGGPSLYYADPKTFKLGKSVTIRAGKSEVAGVNELERVDGKLYGNIFTTRTIVRLRSGRPAASTRSPISACCGR